MANELKMAIVNTITGLLEKGWKHRRIARELGVNRETVGRYARLRREVGSKPANPTPGSLRIVSTISSIRTCKS